MHTDKTDTRNSVRRESGGGGETERRDRLVFRTVWLSDIHLGTRGCSAAFLLDFLRSVECEKLYLVGDIIDFWALGWRPHWPQSHNNVVRTILGKAKHGTEIIYVPGNHDELIRDYAGSVFGNISIRSRAVHDTADGRRLLVLHGDEFDSVVRCSRMVCKLGSWSYGMLLEANRLVNWIRRRLGWPYWSLAGSVKHKVKHAVNYISNFEQAVAYEARRAGVDGVVCGHIHHAEIRSIEDVLYLNCGDWVESCTVLVEHQGGDIELLNWVEDAHSHKRLSDVERLPAAA
ncbi:MAG: UDP-2,3-diacylglucosamine diphosphatase [Gammaproteobacteria bacterium]|nr:UDP-2,3-diacylglucosamine diphosphatase [Gammaproteobacteria bacterium]